MGSGGVGESSCLFFLFFLFLLFLFFLAGHVLADVVAAAEVVLVVVSVLVVLGAAVVLVDEVELVDVSVLDDDVLVDTSVLDEEVLVDESVLDCLVVVLVAKVVLVGLVGVIYTMTLIRNYQQFDPGNLTVTQDGVSMQEHAVLRKFPARSSSWENR